MLLSPLEGCDPSLALHLKCLELNFDFKLGDFKVANVYLLPMVKASSSFEQNYMNMFFYPQETWLKLTSVAMRKFFSNLTLSN